MALNTPPLNEIWGLMVPRFLPQTKLEKNKIIKNYINSKIFCVLDIIVIICDFRFIYINFLIIIPYKYYTNNTYIISIMEYYYSEFNFVLSIVLLNCIIIDYISQSFNLNVILGILQLLYIKICLHLNSYVL